MTDNGTNEAWWKVIARAAGLLIVFVVIVLRATRRIEWVDAQALLGIAACLLGIIQLLKNGTK